jgi:hypothetical protein
MNLTEIFFTIIGVVLFIDFVGSDATWAVGGEFFKDVKDSYWDN